MLITSLDSILHTFLFSSGMFRIFSFTFVNSSFLYVILTFSKIIFLEIKIFSNLLRSCSSSVNGFIYVLLCTACHEMTYLDKLLVHVWQIIFSPLSKVSTILIAYRFSWYLPWQKSFTSKCDICENMVWPFPNMCKTGNFILYFLWHSAVFDPDFYFLHFGHSALFRHAF